MMLSFKKKSENLLLGNSRWNNFTKIWEILFQWSLNIDLWGIQSSKLKAYASSSLIFSPTFTPFSNKAIFSNCKIQIQFKIF